ncbi:MAG: hypothetical protein V4714_05950 [Bacteroidota bacterium]
MSFKFKLLFFIFSLGCVGVLKAQTVGNSPYSFLGVGDLYSPAFIPNTAMGGVGVSNGNGSYVNHINPALLARNKIVYFEAGLFLHFKTLVQSYKSQGVKSGNLNYMSLAFPISSRWTAGLTLMPYSRVEYTAKGYSRLAAGILGNNLVNYTYKGRGGLTQVNFTNGVDLFRTFTDKQKKILRQRLSIGLESTFLFGNISTEKISQIVNDQSFIVAGLDRVNYADFSFKPGLAFHQRLKENLFMNVGATYSLAVNTNAKRFAVLQQRAPNDEILAADTLMLDRKGSVTLPSQYQFGLSLESPYRWTIAADFSYQQWSQYQSYGDKKGLSDTYKFSIGGEFTPNLNAIDGYLNRVTYRLGVNYSQLPFVVNGRQLEDRSISLGGSFPMGKGITDLNLAFVLGQTGQNTPIKEDYFKLFLGFTLRDNSWFHKRKID